MSRKSDDNIAGERKLGVRSSRKSDPIPQLERLTMQLSELENSRSEKRSLLDSLYEQLQNIRNQMTLVQEELQLLDDEIELVEKKRNRAIEKERGHLESSMASFGKKHCEKDLDTLDIAASDTEDHFDHDHFSQTQKYADNLTQCITKDGQRIRKRIDEEDQDPLDESDSDAESHRNNQHVFTMNPEEIFTEPTQTEYDTNDEKKMESSVHQDAKQKLTDIPYRNQNPYRPSSGGYPELELVKASKRIVPPISIVSGKTTSMNAGQPIIYEASPPVTMTLTTGNKMKNTVNNNTTLDRFFKTSEDLKPPSLTDSAPTTNSIFPPVFQQRYAQGGNNNNRLQNKSFDVKMAYNLDLKSDDFPWSGIMMETLRNNFGIRDFRDNQKQIINCTMSGLDTFVIMRTGGGKSLTYQLPALLEGRSKEKKVTLVVSPLLSLIRDQEDQMNVFAPGSAISFTSGISGGTTEHQRRWDLVRDPNSGICIVFVTPEKVHKSNKLKSELEKLHSQGRLGRFVIDECHCCCQWGHDFRPDYTQLGILKTHFPDIPLIAVTATASDRVREDCCKILRLGANYKFFRSSANRPNLTYSIREKQDNKDAVIADMANFIETKHKNHAGIIYTLSKKEAEDVATKLGTYNITARAYHSDISDATKENIHKSWMKNKTQIVVATIAFGLGINKPDVRFVLHHSLSKTLEAYYQESGRAGRDGGPADCVLYYSPKDVSRMLGMIHGQGSERSFWSMVRYGQEHGDDATCRRVILSTLGEPIEHTSRSSLDNVVTRDVTTHTRNVIRLIDWSVKSLTIQQLVQLWRGKEAPAFVHEHPPSTDLSKDDCERLIVDLFLSEILSPSFVFSPYSTIIYVQQGDHAQAVLSNPKAQVLVKFPIRPTNTKAASSTAAESVASKKGQWISSKKSKKTVTLDTPPKRTKKRSLNAKEKLVGTKASEPIHILADSDDSSEDELRPSMERNGPAKLRRVTDDHFYSHA